jgi:hypothetical protein
MYDIVTPYVKNPDGSLKLDSLGRRRHILSNKGGAGRPSQHLKHVVTARLDEDMKIALAGYAAKKGRPIADCLRDFIEWGLENDHS